MAIKVFFHICAINNVREIVAEMTRDIIVSGLYAAAAQIYCFISGDARLAHAVAAELCELGPKFCVVCIQPGDTTYERLTLQNIHAYTDATDFILYIHSKGVSDQHQPEQALARGEPVERVAHRQRCIADWRRMVMYFLVGQFRRCIELMTGGAAAPADTVSVNLRADHWNGNFWWVRGDYFQTLPRVIGPGYFDPETRFLFLNHPRAIAIHNSTCPQHYEYRYPPSQYL